MHVRSQVARALLASVVMLVVGCWSGSSEVPPIDLEAHCTVPADCKTQTDLFGHRFVDDCNDATCTDGLCGSAPHGGSCTKTTGERSTCYAGECGGGDGLPDAADASRDSAPDSAPDSVSDSVSDSDSAPSDSPDSD